MLDHQTVPGDASWGTPRSEDQAKGGPNDRFNHATLISMARLTGQQLAKLRHASYRPTVTTDLQALSASELPADLVPIKSAAALLCKTRSFFSRHIRSGAFKAWRVGPSAILVSLSQCTAAIQAERRKPVI